MEQFIKRIISFILPGIGLFGILALLYFRVDPYADFGVKSNYSWKYYFQQLGDLSTKKLVNSSADYNSFIFGSSRTTGIYACYLQERIPGSRFFHYAHWGETIGGINQKIKLLDQRGYDLNNVIIYLDTDVSFEGEGKCRPADHYLLTGQKQVKTQLKHFKSFFTNMDVDQLKILLGMRVSGEVFPNWHSDPETNDPTQVCTDSLLQHYAEVLQTPAHIRSIDSMKQAGFLYERPAQQSYLEPQISPAEKNYLYEIKSTFDQHNTHYYVVITPLYDQHKFALEDLQILRECFGDRLYDFSGISDISNNLYNYPDRKHFQPYISKMILDSIIPFEGNISESEPL